MLQSVQKEKEMEERDNEKTIKERRDKERGEYQLF